MPGKAKLALLQVRHRLVVFAVVMLCAFVIPGYLARESAKDQVLAVANAAVTDATVDETRESAKDWSQTDQARLLALQLQVVCPQAAHAWQQEVNLDNHAETGVVPRYRQLANRQLAAHDKPDGEWLVAPEQWFVEEDGTQSEIETTPPANDAASDSHAGPASPTEKADLFPPPVLSQPEGAVEAQPDSPREVLSVPKPSTSTPFAPPPVTPPINNPLGFEPIGDRLPSPHGSGKTPAEGSEVSGEEAHRELLARNCYPSAQECAKCHKKIYEEWSISSHAYAMVSPMFHKFEQKIREVSQGTVGHFCYRCHAPVATALGVGQEVPLWELTQVEREGVTCIACHRVKYRYTKSNGERRVEPGDIYDPVYGSIGGDGIANTIANPDTYKVKTSDDQKGPGQAIHRDGYYFDQLSKAEFCSSCHQVAVHPGIKLEVVWDQYRQSPARRKGVTCQDCHMGRVPGIASGYEVCAIAEVGEKTVCDTRKHGNHTFYGPGYSIAHPGVFPFHEKADRWTMNEWLQFDWRAGWGTDQFEDAIDAGTVQANFPAVWAETDDRYDAREIIEDNLKLLARKTESRRQVMENGSHVDGPFFKSPPRRGNDLVLHYDVANTNEGHNLPTASLGAQPQLWANVVLIDPDGQRVWETGYTDHWGDLCDIHSQDVRHGRVPFDSQLFNLQTMFLITGATGTDREFVLPVNVDFDQLPFLRPGAIPTSVTNHPPFIRMESRSIAPLGVKRVKYSIPGDALCKPGTYRLSFRMRSRTEPIYFMRFCEATIEMQRAMNEGVIDVHPYSVEFVVE